MNSSESIDSDDDESAPISSNPPQEWSNCSVVLAGIICLILLVVVVTVSLVVSHNYASDPIPTEWESSLWIQGDHIKPAFISNGYLSAMIDSPQIYVRGLWDQTNASKKTRFSVTGTINIKLPDCQIIGSALDMNNSTFYIRSKMSGKTRVEQRFYMHQEISSLFVHEIYVDNQDGDYEARIRLDFPPNTGKPVCLLPCPTTHEFNVFQYSPEGNSNISVFVKVAKAVPFVTVAPFKTKTLYYHTTIRSSLDSKNPKADVIADFLKFEKDLPNLHNRHVSVWSKIWSSRVITKGLSEKPVASSFYYLLTNLYTETVESIPQDILTSSAFEGHTFMDSELSYSTSLLLGWPNITKQFIHFRLKRLSNAIENAKQKGYLGCLFPSEDNGSMEGNINSSYPQVLTNGLVALALRQQWFATRNQTWLLSVFPILSNISDFYCNFTAFQNDTYSLLNVADLNSRQVNYSIFTNAVAKLAVEFTVASAKQLKRASPIRWIYFAHDISTPILEPTKQFMIDPQEVLNVPEVLFLHFPLMQTIPRRIRENNVEYYAPRIPRSAVLPAAITLVSWLELDRITEASILWNQILESLQKPFLVWKDPITQNHLPSAGAFIQSLLYGYIGVRLKEDRISFSPVLPPNTTEVSFPNIHYLGSVFSVEFNSSSVITKMVSAGKVGFNFVLPDGKTHLLESNNSIVFDRGPFEVYGSTR